MFHGAESQWMRLEPQNQGKPAFLIVTMHKPLAVSENNTDSQHNHLCLSSKLTTRIGLDCLILSYVLT